MTATMIGHIRLKANYNIAGIVNHLQYILCMPCISWLVLVTVERTSQQAEHHTHLAYYGLKVYMGYILAKRYLHIHTLSIHSCPEFLTCRSSGLMGVT